MKINSWSVVKSPIGISIKHIKDKKLSSVEVCMSMIDGKLDISVYHDGVDEPISQAQHITNRVALVRKKPTNKELLAWQKKVAALKKKGAK